MTDGVRDPAIKLFGRAIPLPESPDPPEPGSGPDPTLPPGPAGCEKEICAGIASTEAKDPMPDAFEVSDQDESGSSTGLINDNEDKNQTLTRDDKAAADSKTEQHPSEADGLDQEKVLKKPDKLLPCPRCKSLNTKFCYYNNYNVNQPRHFCKNCQRYWTAGGAMRNVPVGAGRRKNKHHRHVMMLSGGFPCTRVDGLDSAHHQVSSAGLSGPVKPLTGNETLLKFGPEATSSVLNLGDKKRNAENGSVVGGEKREELSCASTVTVSNCVDNDLPRVPVDTEKNGLHASGLSNVHHMPCFPGASWSYPWGAGWNNVASISAGHRSSELVHGPENGSPNPVLWGSSPMLAIKAFSAPSIPFPFMPASFWGCIPGWPNGTWNLPCVGSNVGLLPFSFQSNHIGSGNGSPTLGKHSREAILHADEKTEKKSLWFPKTLRIDHPDEAAKSSIWATLGIKLDASMKKGGIFKSFHSQTESESHTSSAAEILRANPAALSRSHTFQEST